MIMGNIIMVHMTGALLSNVSYSAIWIICTFF